MIVNNKLRRSHCVENSCGLTPVTCVNIWTYFYCRQVSKKFETLIVAHTFGPQLCLWLISVNPLITTLKPQSNKPSYCNTVIGTLAVDGWAGSTFGAARRGLCEAAARPGPSSLYQMQQPTPINGQCTNFVLFDVAL